MDSFYLKNRKSWKSRVIEKIKDSSSIIGAINRFIEEYIFYSKDKKELEHRLRILDESVKKSLKNLKKTRKEF